MTASWRTRLLERFVLAHTAGTAACASAESARASIARAALRPAPVTPARLASLFAHLDALDPTGVVARRPAGSRHGWRGYPVFELRRRRAEPEVTVLFLHGGAYVDEIRRWHWYLLAWLARVVPARVVVPIYPLAPRGVAADVVPAVADLVSDLRATTPGRLVVMGDSAGGGLALAAAQVLRDRGGPPPERLVLIAPWLDVTVTHPDQPALARLDRMLCPAGLVECGRQYAGDLDVTDPRVSPLRGELAGLPPMTVLHGTHDVLLPDSRQLAGRAVAAGVEVDYHEAPGLPHDYPLLPVPEGRAGRAVLVRACRPA